MMNTLSDCILCRKTLVPHLKTVIDPFSFEHFSIKKCPECGLGHTIPQPIDMTQYYSSVYYGNRHGLTSLFCAIRRLRIASLFKNRSEKNRLLDMGCGDGAYISEAEKRGWATTGIDINPDISRHTGLTVGKTIEDIQHRGPFQVITFWHSLEHFPDPISALGQISEVLSPKGKVIIAVPDNGGLQAKLFKRYWWHLDVPRHLYHFNAKSLKKALVYTGYRPIRCWHQEFEYDLLGWSQSMLNRIFPVPNVFYQILTHKIPMKGESLLWMQLIMGGLFSVLSIPAVLGGSALQCGGTLIMAAEKR